MMNRREMMASVAGIAAQAGATAGAFDEPPLLFVIKCPAVLSDAMFNRTFIALKELTDEIQRNTGKRPSFVLLEEGCTIEAVTDAGTIEGAKVCT